MKTTMDNNYLANQLDQAIKCFGWALWRWQSNDHFGYGVEILDCRNMVVVSGDIQQVYNWLCAAPQS